MILPRSYPVFYIAWYARLPHRVKLEQDVSMTARVQSVVPSSWSFSGFDLFGHGLLMSLKVRQVASQLIRDDELPRDSEQGARGDLGER